MATVGMPWLLALVAYKPMAGFIYATGLTFVGQGDSLGEVMTGLTIARRGRRAAAGDVAAAERDDMAATSVNWPQEKRDDTHARYSQHVSRDGRRPP